VAGHPYLSGYHGSAMNLGGTVRLAQRRVMRQALLLDKQRAFKLHRPLGSDQREFETHLIEGTFPICVASDDPCLTGINTSSPRKDCTLLSYFSQFECDH
jgi:hypothetical protein